MNTNEDNIIGIVGGMGPHAGSVVFNHILRLTKAQIDQEHLSVILMSFPKHIVDRTAFLTDKANVNPGYNIAKIILKMEMSGASIIGIACNTSHAPSIYNIIVRELTRMRSQVKLVNMPYETCKFIKNNHPEIRRIGVMCTNGTYISKVYQSFLSELGYEVVVPNFDFQDNVVNRIIYDPEFGIKSSPNLISSEARSLMKRAIDYFVESKTQAIILGCTELPLMLTENPINGVLIIDSSEVLAKALLNRAIMFEHKDCLI